MNEHKCNCQQHSCGCGHEHHESSAKDIVVLGVGTIFFVVGLVLQDICRFVSIGSFVVAYLALGFQILKAAGKNLLKGTIFDENFLMSIATISAFIIGEVPEAVGVMLFFRVGEFLEGMATQRSRHRIEEAVDLRPETVVVIHSHGNHVIPATEVQVGDVLLVRVGERIPVDGTVVEGESRIDMSPITGESVPIKVEKDGKVISGCMNTSGVLKIRADQVLEDSMVSRILHSVEQATANKPKAERFITRFAKVYTPIVVILALVTAIVPSLFDGNWTKWIYTAITFLVISCPCALVLSIPLAFFAGIGAGAKKGILFKSGLVLEVLQRIKAVVLDKTGTVTKGVFEVQQCVPLCDLEEREILALAAMCELQSSHPIAVSIVEEAGEQKVEIEEPSLVKEIAGQGICATGKMGEILCGNRKLLLSYGVTLPENDAFCYGTEVLVACNGKLLGYIVIADTLKNDAKNTVSELRAEGIHTAMLTGDTKRNATTIATLVGIEEVHAALLPEDKLVHVSQIQKQKGPVLFVGDGINDGPVLAGADVGAAMGNGADVAIEAADLVFMTSSMQAISESLRIAKKTNRIVIQNIVLALGVKVFVMLLGLFGVANMWLAVLADTGVALLCVLNSIRLLRIKEVEKIETIIHNERNEKG